MPSPRQPANMRPRRGSRSGHLRVVSGPELKRERWTETVRTKEDTQEAIRLAGLRHPAGRPKLVLPEVIVTAQPSPAQVIDIQKIMRGADILPFPLAIPEEPTSTDT